VTVCHSLLVACGEAKESQSESCETASCKPVDRSDEFFEQPLIDIDITLDESHWERLRQLIGPRSRNRYLS
jgi:hypothetical protein